MADSTTNIDTIESGQVQPEVTANQYFDAASPATLFGRRGSAASLLTWAYYGGDMLVDGVLTSIANGTVTLTASNTNYVEATRAGVVSCNTTGFTAGRIPLYTVVVGTTAPTSYTDNRAWVDPSYITHQVSIAITSADVTLTAAQARARHIILTGTLTGDRNLIVPNNGEWVVYNNTSGAYSVTVKTSAGTGDTVTQGTNRSFFADGTNVIATTTGGGSSVNSFATIAVSGQSDVVADSSTDTLTLVAGTGITLTTNAGSDSVTITNSGTASNSFTTIAVSGQSDVVADSATDTLTLVAGSNITLTTNAGTDTITIASSGGGGGGGITLGTPQASTSGTSIDFTSIPAGTKRIDVMFNGVSVSGTSPIIVQLGDSGGAENTGYTGAVSGMSSTVSTATLSSGFALSDSGTSAAVLNGTLHLTLLNSSTFLWSATGLFGRSNSAAMFICGGIKALSAELDRIRITCANGTDTFDAGSINIQYM
jgi:hypothetical protein